MKYFAAILTDDISLLDKIKGEISILEIDEEYRDKPKVLEHMFISTVSKLQERL